MTVCEIVGAQESCKSDVWTHFGLSVSRHEKEEKVTDEKPILFFFSLSDEQQALNR